MSNLWFNFHIGLLFVGLLALSFWSGLWFIKQGCRRKAQQQGLLIVGLLLGVITSAIPLAVYFSRY